MSTSVIIPSAKIGNVERCVAAIREHQPDMRIIVVADGITAADRERVPCVEWIEGIKPFCFSRNVNLGIVAAGADDVILCNDDAILATPHGFDALAESTADYGIISATIIGRCGNPRQTLEADITHLEPNTLAFVCVLITRATIDRIGLLDEEFANGTWEDNDYCRRATQAGILLGICGTCRMFHRADHTTFEKRKDYRKILRENRRRFEAKWSLHRIALSICICSIVTRRHFLDRLLEIISPQLCDRVELLMAIDSGEESIGSKRQRLLEAARGDYVVSIDDDDTITTDYVAEILAAIARTPDVDAITFRATRYADGDFDGVTHYSMTHTGNRSWQRTDAGKLYMRWPQHITPIRRQLALEIGFVDIDFGEDAAFAEDLRPLLRSEQHIPKVLYTYFWRSARPGEQTHLTRLAPSPSRINTPAIVTTGAR